MSKKVAASKANKTTPTLPLESKPKFRVEDDIEKFITLRLPCSLNGNVFVKKLWTSYDGKDTFYRCNCLVRKDEKNRMIGSYFVKISTSAQGKLEFENMTILPKE